MMIVFLTVAFFAIAMAIMAVGLISKNRCLRGSCGGPEVRDAQGESLRCDACPKHEDDGADYTTLPPVTKTTEPVT